MTLNIRHGNGAFVVVRGRESRLHGEGVDGRSYSSKETSAGLELEQLMQTSLKKIIKQAKPDVEMRPAEEPGAIIPHARICEGAAG